MENLEEYLNLCKYRYKLPNQINYPQGNNRLIYVMLNPASCGKDISQDKTIRNCIEIKDKLKITTAYNETFNGIEILNLLPCISPHPNDAMEWFNNNKYKNICLEKNIEVWNEIINDSSKTYSHSIVLAWGSKKLGQNPIYKDLRQKLYEKFKDNYVFYTLVNCESQELTNFPRHPADMGLMHIKGINNTILRRLNNIDYFN